MPKIKLSQPWLLVAAITLITFFLIRPQPIYVDELVHHAVVKNFCDLNFALHPNLTNIPGYHILVSIPCYLLKNFLPANTLAATRFFSLIISLIALPLFLAAGRKLKAKFAILKTLQLFLLPLAFPFFFLVYTDIPSLMLVLAAFYATHRKKYGLSGLLATFSIAVRQNNIVWLGFLAVYIFLVHFSAKLNFKNILRYLVSVWSFILGTLGFAAFVFLNGGITLGKAEDWAHPSFRLYFSNVFFLLFLFFFIFFPLILNSLPKLLRLLRKKTSLLLVPILLVVGAIFWFTFENSHPYNQHTFAIHNWILVYFTADNAKKALFFLPVAFSLLYLAVTRLRTRHMYLLYPFTVLFLLPSWLIEPRYYIVPFAFFHLFRVSQGRKTEVALVWWSALLSGIVLFGILSKRFFP